VLEIPGCANYLYIRLQGIPMKKLYLPIIALALALQPMSRAHAQTQSTPQQLQALIAAGQEQTALQQLNTVLQAHPDSGVAWYLVAEAQDASGNKTAARSALAKAEQYAPGLPFANPQKVAALQAHLAAPAAVAPQEHHGISPFLIIGALIVLFIGIRLFSRARRQMPGPYYRNDFGGGVAGAPPGGPFGGAPSYGAAPGMGSSILSGLAAGAGFAAGERIIDGLMDHPRDTGMIDPASGATPPAPAPDRDDGLSGSPDWNSGSTGDDNQFDSGNNW